MLNHQKLRENYKPNKIKVLFVAESPPERDTFFYSGKSFLHHYTRKAFYTYYKDEIEKFYLNFLDFFKSKGFYLDDLCHKPSKFSDIRKDKEQYITELSRRLSRYNPKAVIITPIRIDKFVREALSLSGLVIDPELVFTLYFAGNGYQNKYANGLEKVLIALISKGIIE